ncbi:MAG: dephospho-CoA kinase [Mycobacteriales bacterium]
MLRVGLTGGIGSGKSTVSALLTAHGAVVIDFDLLAREVVEPGTPGLAAVVDAFGGDVLDPQDNLDRSALGLRVFDDADARRALEGIVHPLVRARAAEIEAAAPKDAVIVHDTPLLVETGQAASFDVVVVVDVPVELQVERLVAERAMREEDARARVTTQASREQRRAVADFVVDNTGSRDDLSARVDQLWADLGARAQ